MTQGHQLDHLLPLLKPFFDKVLLEHVGLPHVHPLTFQLFQPYDNYSLKSPLSMAPEEAAMFFLHIVRNW